MFVSLRIIIFNHFLSFQISTLTHSGLFLIQNTQFIEIYFSIH